MSPPSIIPMWVRNYICRFLQCIFVPVCTINTFTIRPTEITDMNAVIFPLTRLQGLRVVLWRLALAPLVLGLCRFWQVVGGGVGAERRGARGSHGWAGLRARRAGRTLEVGPWGRRATAGRKTRSAAPRGWGGGGRFSGGANGETLSVLGRAELRRSLNQIDGGILRFPLEKHKKYTRFRDCITPRTTAAVGSQILCISTLFPVS